MSSPTSAAVRAEANHTENPKSGYSFYQKLFFLYFMNLVDWVCTEALLISGQFYEANPIMRPVLNGFWQTLFIKGALPLALTLFCAYLFRLARMEESRFASTVLYIGIGAYMLVNLWHILNFILLFSA